MEGDWGPGEFPLKSPGFVGAVGRVAIADWSTVDSNGNKGNDGLLCVAVGFSILARYLLLINVCTHIDNCS